MNYKFEDLIDMKELSSLLSSLYNIINIPVSISDADGKTLIVYGCRDICSNFYKNNEIAYESCKNNAVDLINIFKKNKECIVYKCNNGLFSIVYPVYLQDELIAAISSGQFFCSKVQKNICLKRSQTYCFNQKEFAESINHMPVLSDDQISKLRSFVIDVGKMLSSLCYRELKQIELQNMLKKEYEELKLKHIELCKAEKKLISDNKKIIKLAYCDDLTGLPNRAYLIKKLKAKIRQVSEKGKKIAIIFMDLDDFKNANSLGYDYGNRILIKAGSKIEKCISCDDLLCRYGEDEFLILKSEFKSIDEVHELVKNIFNEFRKPWKINNQKIHVNTSMGVSIFPDNAKDADAMIEYADMALYKAKNRGKSRVEYFNDSMYDEIVENAKMQMSFVEALKNNEFFLTYQPQVNAKTGKVFGTEALIRWNTPDRGVISPAAFIPAAEQNGFIIELGEWVLREACRQNKLWQDKGYRAISIAVNVSEKQLQNNDFVEMIVGILKETKLEPQYLELELTESAMMENTDINISKLQKLKQMGIKIALDDFGTGYSSLNYLRMFPINTIKIDKSFISNVYNDSYEKMITNSIIQLGQKMNLNVIAEGVEIKEQLNFLESTECYNIQGYLFYRPCMPDDLEKILFQDVSKKDKKTNDNLIL